MLTADTGVYNLRRNCRPNGTSRWRTKTARFVTSTARLDIAHNTAEGSDRWRSTASGDIKSQGFRIYDKGDTIVFTGKSDMLLKGAKVIAANAPPPPAVPPAVAATAARVEAQAKVPAGGAAPPAASQHRAPEKAKQAKQTKPDATPQRPSAGPAGDSSANGKRS